ncbi:MAG TPA: proton-conducting transporter membrane subunit [Candidatus Limnocylindria bacterium]|nr:proton-conducting transporter membrane subunit [Candidatus Limnocylindria bacterium]
MTLILAIALPIVGGALLPAFRWKRRAARSAYVMALTLLASALTLAAILGDAPRLDLLRISERLTLSFRLDGMGRVFAGIAALLWPLTSLYALDYMRGEKGEDTFFAFFTISFGVTLGIAMSANLLTLYVFYEMLSLSTLPLVMHGGEEGSVAAGLKYLYYSLGGAAFAFIGLVYLVYFGGTTEFTAGGLFRHIAIEQSAQLRLGYLLCFLGFSVKAAVFPVHGWLPTASVAPTPVTALLHAVAVVKSGVFAILRVTYFSFGAVVIRGSYAQAIPLILTSFTIVFGCSMALKEKHLKRRLAYSTVSNLSYILFGAMLLTAQGLAAGLLHMVFHSLMKIALFMAAGVYNVRGRAYDVRDLRGLGPQMPLISSVFVLGSAAMTGLPPLLGFISKWALGQAAVNLGGVLPVLGLTALLISAVLTGIYLMAPSVFLYTGKRPEGAEAPLPVEPGMRLTLAALGIVILALGFYSQPLADFLARTAPGLV